MKFIFADSMDLVDPRFDFIEDESPQDRKPYWDDQYPHELLGYAPYDGVLVSRGVVGDHRMKGKYSNAQSMRFSRVGSREFLRLDKGVFRQMPIFGDCGAFSYAQMEEPPYSPDEVVEFYEQGDFTHGCSVDHIIFEFDRNGRELEGGSQDARQRFEITLDNAEVFLKRVRSGGSSLTPMGVVQGWSPGSKAEAARRLVAMGYDYLAIGGMVPLGSQSIHACLQAIAEKIPPNIRVHLLGFAKAENIHEFEKYGIASFDTTSPLIRAFKDSKANYYVPNDSGTFDYYTAIRIPQALENRQLKNGVKTGRLDQDGLAALEADALNCLRAYDQGKATFEETVKRVLEYEKLFSWNDEKSELQNDNEMRKKRVDLERTLRDKPWKACKCPICSTISIEVMIFRGNNRNRRRGFHNLAVFHHLVKNLSVKQAQI